MCVFFLISDVDKKEQVNRVKRRLPRVFKKKSRLVLKDESFRPLN